MPKTKKESLIYSLILCAIMVFTISTIDQIIQNQGVSLSLFKTAVLHFIPAFFIALCIDLLLVSRVAKAVAFRILSPDDSISIKKLTISFCMVLGMCTCMSFFSSVMQTGFSTEAWVVFFTKLPRNFMIALFFQWLIAGPFARKCLQLFQQTEALLPQV